MTTMKSPIEFANELRDQAAGMGWDGQDLGLKTVLAHAADRMIELHRWQREAAILSAELLFERQRVGLLTQTIEDSSDRLERVGQHHRAGMVRLELSRILKQRVAHIVDDIALVTGATGVTDGTGTTGAQGPDHV